MTEASDASSARATAEQSFVSSDDDVGRETDALAQELPISVEAIFGNAWRANTFSIAGDFVVNSEGRRSILPVVDASAFVTDPPHPLIAPPGATALLDLLRRERIVVLTGNGAGKRTAGLLALRDLSLRPLLQLPGDLPVDDLAAGIAQLCKKQPSAGFLIDGVDIEMLGRLSGFKLTQIMSALGSRAALVLTTDARAAGSGGISRFECSPPAAAELAASVVRSRQLSDESLGRVRAALRLLHEPISPSIVLAAVEASRDAAKTAEDIAATVVWRPDALDTWLAQQPTAEELAAMAAAASLEGVPTNEAEIEASRLSEELEPRREPDEAKRFRVRDQTWPVGIIDVETRLFGSHFGRQEVEVLSFCQPHTRDRVLAHLWRKLGSDFRQPYVTWLSGLASSANPRIRSAAAISAGALFVSEPLMVERDLLRPWALSENPAMRRCAGAALGVPVALSGLPAPARMLANAWATSPNVRLRHCAVVAYGGLLGAWDPSSAAAVHLWNIGSQTPSLRAEATSSLAALTSAGAQASRARASVLDLLATASQSREERRRVYEVLPAIMRALTGPHELARESREAFLGEEEEPTFRVYAELLALAFDSASGFQSARDATRALLVATTASWIEPESGTRIIAAIRDAAARRGRLEAFGGALGRVLRGERHRDSPLRDAAEAVLEAFYKET